ncbi:NAD(P)/FAD-dependent oxidoreductase [Sediminicoccus sp. KRV36]|uniref:flavin-containing monooxygenase n=1 Tax=Sediminicoccus sp. KRV36 TaxID=3133721 RepID=UPI00200C7A3B|nr:NAD(P)/FAD-dependent oxidoreductase [Sediminicoccus rosea]UPY35770.1 NAD(P)/FAD-dependent oxidoreductase [Sediminicoccus rosea]
MNAMDHSATATAWLGHFEAALAAGDASALFQPDGHWRDVLAFTWELRTISGAAAIAAALRGARARNFRLDPERSPPRRVQRAGVDCLEVIFAFDAEHGEGHGVARLVEGRAWTLLTALGELAGAAQVELPDYSREFGGENWLDKRNRARAYADHDPAVLVVGGGQAGLSIAARLGQMGVDTLIVDRAARIGDNWRKRYHALTLHNETQVNHLPYLPFPKTWPVFIPKDKLANWFEFYVEAMELNFWTGTELISGQHDGTAWEVTLKRADGSGRVMRPRHLVFATGVSSIPIRPRLPGLDDFAGTVLHSGAYTEGHAWKGKRAIVLGTGNSGHDVAQDLHASGAEVTLIQRSPTHIVSLVEAQRVYSIYTEGLPVEDCDLLATSMPYPALCDSYRRATTHSRLVDQPLLDSLAAVGFRLDNDEGSMGFQMKYLERGGGYYFNVGCSDLIAERRIGLLQYADVDRFVAEGVRLRDGSLAPAELLVLATGYKNQQETARAYLGDAVAERIGPVWGFDAGGELRNMWRPTAQKGLWFTAGSLAQCRIYSKFLAMQIKAREAGLVPQ